MFVLTCIQNTKISFVAIRIIFGCVSLEIHEVNTLIVRSGHCRQLVDSRPEVRYERQIVSVIL
jgi:hypothetical protein